MRWSMEKETVWFDEELLSRRELLKRGAIAGVVIALPALGTAHVGDAYGARVGPAAAGGPSALTADQSALLEAIVERLVPSDQFGPGGKEAGAAAYIERSLQGGLAGGLAGAASLYSSGLAAVDEYAKSSQGGAFTALPPDKQDAVLADVAANKATGFEPDSASFFGAVREHTLQGMFSDPIYGGNKNFAGWDLIGYYGVRMPVAAADQKLGVKVKPAHKSAYAGGSLGSYPKAKKEAVA
jgi:gluconate 2-dehydrogenase gamma chain